MARIMWSAVLTDGSTITSETSVKIGEPSLILQLKQKLDSGEKINKLVLFVNGIKISISGTTRGKFPNNLGDKIILKRLFATEFNSVKGISKEVMLTPTLMHKDGTETRFYIDEKTAEINICTEDNRKVNKDGKYPQKT